MSSTTENTIAKVNEVLAEKGVDAALDYLQETIKSRKKDSVEDLEGLMIKEINISVKYLNKRTIKEDLSYYRNVMQHENGKSLEKVHKYFRDAIETKFAQIKSEMKEDIEIEEVETGFFAEDLMLLAFQSEEQWNDKDKLAPCIKFMVEGYEIILDVLRSNSTMLPLYNTTAEHCMDFCVQNNRKYEFKRITDTLSKHLKNILNQKQELIKNIPYPVIIEDNDSFSELLKLRLKALENTLKMDNWSDALKIVKDIRDLEKYRKNKNMSSLNPQQKAHFLDCIAELFKKAKFHLFYAGALCSADKKYRNWRLRTDEHRSYYADKIILSYLMIPLDDNPSNFKPIGFDILNSENTKGKDFLKYADLIEQTAELNRDSILKSINDSNMLTICSPEVKTIFTLMEAECNKPSDLSQKSEQFLKWIGDHKEYSEFLAELKKNLALRIFQQLGKVFKVLKFSHFNKMFGFLNTSENDKTIEKLIIEGNKTYVLSKKSLSYYSETLMGTVWNAVYSQRERLFSIKIDPQEQKFVFDFYEQNELVTQKLQNFTRELKQVDSMINSHHAISQNEVKRVFAKVNEHIQSEVDEIALRLEQDAETREKMRKDLEERTRKEREEAHLTTEQKRVKHEKERYEQEKRVLREQCLKERDDYLKIKIREMTDFLNKEGVRTVGTTSLKDVMKLSNDVEEVYHIVKESVDEIHKKKQEEASNYANKLLNESDLTEKAKRIFEKPILEEELRKRNETEIADLKENLKTKHENDVKLKHLLINAQKSMDIYIESEMEVRRSNLTQETEQYMQDKTQEIKNVILERAKRKLRQEENKRIIEQRRKELEERDRKRRAEQGLPEKAPAGSSEDFGFSRKGFGTEKVEAPPAYSRPKRDDDSGFSKGPPRFGNKNAEGFSRTGFGQGKVEEEKKDDSRPSGPPKFSGPPRFSGAKKTDTGFGDFRKKPSAAKKDDDNVSQSSSSTKKSTTAKPKKKNKKDGGDAGVGRFSTVW